MILWWYFLDYKYETKTMKESKRFHKVFNFSAILSIAILAAHVGAAQKRYDYARPLMGSVFNLSFYAPSDSLAQVASDSVFARINYLNGILSDYLDGSEVNRLSASAGQGQWVYVSDVLYNVLAQSQYFSAKTSGAFDCTMGPVVQLWRRATRRGYFPEKQQIKWARKAVGYRLVKIDHQQKRVQLKQKNMRLDFGAIGKGYAADQALEVLRHYHILSAFLDAGGDLAIGNAPPQQTGWRVEVSNDKQANTAPQTLILKNCGVATSGHTYRYLEHHGQRYSHIADPRTGVGLRTHVRTTVIASNGTAADALATAFSVLGVKKGQKMWQKMPQIGVWLIETNGQKNQHWKSPNFDLLFSGNIQ